MLESRWYFAYGSNMNPNRVQSRGLSCTAEPQAGTLRNFRLRFNKRSRKNPQAGHANIEPEYGSYVEGVLYPLADEQEVLKMDRFESAPTDYRRELVFIETMDTLELAWTYIANERVIDNNLAPPAWYVDHLLAGSEFLSRTYIESIESVDVIPGSTVEQA